MQGTDDAYEGFPSPRTLIKVVGILLLGAWLAEAVYLLIRFGPGPDIEDA